MNPETLPGTTDRRVAGLLRLLAQNATIVISGARIAREIGVSRSTVWRWVERLRELGVKVKGQAATGYFLEKVPDVLTPDVLKRRLKGNLFGKRIYHFFKTDSTNRVAFELGHAGEPEGAIAHGIAGSVAARIRGRLQSLFARRNSRRDSALRSGFQLRTRKESARDQQHGELRGHHRGIRA